MDLLFQIVFRNATEFFDFGESRPMTHHLYQLLAMGFHRGELPANIHLSQVQAFCYAASLSHELLSRMESLESQVLKPVHIPCFVECLNSINQRIGPVLGAGLCHVL